MWPQKVPSSPSVAEYIHLSIVSDGVLTDGVWRGLEMKTNGHGSKMRVAYTLTSDSLHIGVWGEIQHNLFDISPILFNLQRILCICLKYWSYAPYSRQAYDDALCLDLNIQRGRHASIARHASRDPLSENVTMCPIWPAAAPRWIREVHR